MYFYFNRLSILIESESLDISTGFRERFVGQKGRKRPADAEFLLEQVARKFAKEKERLKSAKKAADELGVCLSSFYKYLNKENVPDMRVLQAAAEKWHIKWTHLDPSEVLRPRRIETTEQLVFSFLKEMRQEDIEVFKVTPDGTSVLQVVLKIRIPSGTSGVS
jgi:hypothetical protein